MNRKSTLTTLILFIGLSVFVFTASDVLAYTSGDSGVSTPSLFNLNPLDFFNSNLLKGAAQNIGVSTAVPNLSGFQQILDTKNLSFNDISGSLKAIGTLAINLFLIVIQAVAAILRGLLPFLSK